MKQTMTEVVETTILSTFFQQRAVSCYHRLTKAASMQCSVAGKATPVQLIFFFQKLGI